MPFMIDLIEKEGALGEGAGLVRPVVLDATEYVEGDWKALPKLVERGTGSRRVAEDEVEEVGGVTVNV